MLNTRFSGELGSKVRWTNLNPQKILETMKNLDTGFPYETLEQHMKRVILLVESLSILFK